MSIRTSLQLVGQRARENSLLVHTALAVLAARGGVDAILGRRKSAVATFAQVHRTTRLRAMRRLVEPYVFANRAITYGSARVREDSPVSKHFGGRISVLKEPGEHGERGVLFVMFSETLPLVFSRMNASRLLADYTVVCEPSWSGYCDEDFLRLTAFDEKIFVLAAQKDDFEFLQRLGSNLVPVALGPCDWVDPHVAQPHLGASKEFDIVMNSHWGASKRHHALFRFLKRTSRKYKVLLIGGSWEGRSIEDVRSMAEYYGVLGQLTFAERVPYQRVMQLTCSARVAVLLSLKEGSNRAIAESIFCNVPVVVLSNHVGGIVKNVVPETGLLTSERGLQGAVDQLLGGSLNPRNWGLANISCFESSAKLNDLLREHALAEGRPWTRDIAVRANSPESRYVNPSDELRLSPWNQRLAEYVLP